ncbi:MAG: toprim domain-containing protein, partial [Polyangiales bacterium]
MAPNDPIASLIALLSRLPGVGHRTAARLAFHVLEGDAQYAQALGKALSTIHDDVTRCELCGNYGAESRCAICQDPRRDESVVCIVAKVPDLIALEALGSFRGRYHVLHGLLAPLDGVGPDQLPLDSLERRVADEGIK